MYITSIYPIFHVPLRHVKEHRRDTRLSASSTGERLAYILHLDRRDGGKHPCGTGIYKARCYCFRSAFSDTGLPPTPPMAASGSVAIQDVHHSTHTAVPFGWTRGKRSCSLGRCRGTADRSARKKTIETLLQTKSQTRTARLLRLSVDQVRHVMERSVSFGLSLRRSTQVYRHLSIDENICTMYEYFEIFLARMTMCSRAARVLDTKFSLRVNGQKVL